MRSRATLVLLAAAFLLLAGPSGSALAQEGTVFRPSDQTPPKGQNPCAKNVVPDDVYNSFKDLLAQVLGTTGGVPADIDSQVKGKVPPGDQSPVDVEIFVVDLTQFQNEYSDDVDSLSPGKTPQQLKDEATGLFNQNSAYTYVSDKRNAAGKQKIKIKVFCKESFRTATIDKSTMRELLVHELVHAKLYTMLVLGLAEGSLPFRDHDEDPGTDNTPGTQGGDKEFYDEVRRLFNLLKTNLKLSYAPESTFTSPVSATLVRLDPNTGAVIARIALFGSATVAIGSAGDGDGDGRLDVPIRIQAMALSGGGASVRLNPFHPSIGSTEEPARGGPFPATSFFTLIYEVRGAPENATKQSTMRATVSAWPPFDEQYVNFHPSRPVDLEKLVFLSTNFDGDGLPDQLDPDDDNDGVPDVEDPHPRHPRHA